MLPEERVAGLARGLADAKATISPHYDEILGEVAERNEAASSVGKGDIAMLVVWKNGCARIPAGSRSSLA